MIPRINGTTTAALEHIGPQEKAALIYQQARSDLSSRLWNAALGERAPQGTSSTASPGMGVDALVALLGGDKTAQVPSPPAAFIPQPRPSTAGENDEPSSGDTPSRQEEPAIEGLGPNAGYAATLGAAAGRTGLPPAMLATIVHAEAATGPDGRWLTFSRNPRSSAAGLGQFLSGTWISETERPGTWLHGIASSHGWLDGQGRVAPEARSALLQLRYDGETSIQAVADYARSNLDQLRAAGVAIGQGVGELARSAYVSHHLGISDAVRFLRGELAPDRARKLLKAQIGGAAAEQRIAEAGDATRAHRDWLLGFMARTIQPVRFASLGAGTSAAHA